MATPYIRLFGCEAKRLTDREARCGSWWRGKTEQERFLLYYTCLRVHYEMPAAEALRTAKENWHHFGQNGDLMSTLRDAVKGSARF